jgi:hypothetical protein
VRAWFCVSLLLVAVGCGSNEPQLQTVVPVAVDVRVQGAPAVNAIVTFHPTSDDPATALATRPRGTVGADGIARLTSYYSDDGAPEGDYLVTIVWPNAKTAREDDPPAPDRLQGRYAHPKRSKLTASVRKDAAPIPFHLPK